MNRTPFYNIHQSLNAKLVPFAGYEMPVQYSGIIEEHLAVRRAVGVFDVSHMGEVEISGSDALSFLQRVTINDISKLSLGRVQYSAMCYDDGGIVDDLLVYHLDDRYMLVINAANIEKDIAWLVSQQQGDVQLKDVSNETALLAVQGPHSLATLQPLTDVDLSSLAYYHSVQGVCAGVPMLISRTGYTGELGFELYFPADTQSAERVWNGIFHEGAKRQIMPVGLGARDTLRLEMGFCLYGHEIDQTTNPLEASLGWITKMEKDKFIGKDAIVRMKQQGIKRKLVGFTLPDKALARQGCEIVADGKKVGHVTSGTFSPSLQHGIGMGYVPAEFATSGTTVQVVVRGKEIPATVVNVPFLKKSS